MRAAGTVRPSEIGLRTTAVLTKPAIDVANCLRHAAECELWASRSRDLIAKENFLDMAQRWRRIAQTFEYPQRLEKW